VFDGHGGDAVSKWLEENFITYLKTQYIKTRNYEEALAAAFDDCDLFLRSNDGVLKQYYVNKEMIKEGAKLGDHMGSTAIVAII
jgi:serine/threonine protein phosphatase PrpC